MKGSRLWAAEGWSEEEKIFQRGGGCPGFGFFFKERELSLVAGAVGKKKIVPTWGELELLVFFGQRAKGENQPRERGKKSEPGGCGGPLEEDRFRSFLGFFFFFVVSPPNYKMPPFLFKLWTSIYR